MNRDSDQNPISLADDIWQLGNYYFNLYLVKGSKASALVEMGVSAITDLVLDQLEFLNIHPDYLIITHPHADHVTGLEGLQARFPKAPIITGKGAKEFLGHPKAIESMFNEDIFISRSLSNLGIMPGRSPIQKPISLSNNLVVDRRLEVDLGGVTLKIFKVTGHSPGGIIVHIPEHEISIVSDCLGFHYPGRGFLPLYLTDYSDYVNTLEFISSLNPRMLCPAHQGVIAGNARDSLNKAKYATFDLLSRVNNNHIDSTELADEIFRECYRDEFTIYSEDNIRTVAQLLVRRAIEFGINWGRVTR